MTIQEQISALRKGANGIEILNILDSITGTDSIDQVPQVDDNAYFLTWDGRHVQF